MDDDAVPLPSSASAFAANALVPGNCKVTAAIAVIATDVTNGFWIFPMSSSPQAATGPILVAATYLSNRLVAEIHCIGIVLFKVHKLVQAVPSCRHPYLGSVSYSFLPVVYRCSPLYALYRR